MTIVEIIILGYIVNFFILVIGVIYYIVKLANEQSIGELTQIDNKTRRSRVQGGFFIPYAMVLERILVHMEYRKFKAQGGKRFIDFIDYMFVEKDK